MIVTDLTCTRCGEWLGAFNSNSENGRAGDMFYCPGCDRFVTLIGYYQTIPHYETVHEEWKIGNLKRIFSDEIEKYGNYKTRW